MMRLPSRSLATLVLVVVLGCSQLASAFNATVMAQDGYKMKEAIDKTNPVEAKVDPKTIWWWCGFKSMQKLSVNIQTTRTVTVYTVAKDALRKSTKVKGWLVNSGGRFTRHYDGWYIPYDRCLVIRNDAAEGSGEYAVAELRATTSNDQTLILVLCGIVAGGLLVLTCFLWCLIKLCHLCCGKRKKQKGYSHPV